MGARTGSIVITSARLMKFREAQRQIAEMRGRDDRRGADAIDLQELALTCADRLADTLTFARETWHVDGEPVPSIAVLAAVHRILPAEISGERRQYLATVVVQSFAFRNALTKGRKD